MKAFRLILFVVVLLLANSVKAQVSVTLNIGAPPMWGPAGYVDVQYYYLPDVQAYYDVHSSMFIYQSGGVWIHRTYLPSRYRNYDLYGGYKVVMSDYHGNTPYTHYKEHRAKYARGYHGPAQRSIGQRPARGYSEGHHQNEGRSYKESRHGNDRSDGHDNRKNSEKGRDHGDGHNKKK